MDASQLKVIAALGHEIGAHTVHHVELTRVPWEIARQEVEASKQQLEELLQTPVRSFAYPKGLYNAEVRHIVARAGYELAVTIKPGLLERPVKDPLTLPRVWVSGWLSMRGFRARLSPATRVYVRCRELLARKQAGGLVYPVSPRRAPRLPTRSKAGPWIAGPRLKWHRQPFCEGNVL